MQSRVFHSIRSDGLERRATMVDVLLTVTYRFEIVLGTLGLNTRGLRVPMRRHQKALPKTSQNDLLSGIGPTSSNMPSNPRNHQYLLVPLPEKSPLCDFYPPRVSPPPRSRSCQPVRSAEMFYIAKSMLTSRSTLRSVPFLPHVEPSLTVSSSKSRNYRKCISIFLSR